MIFPSPHTLRKVAYIFPSTRTRRRVSYVFPTPCTLRKVAYIFPSPRTLEQEFQIFPQYLDYTISHIFSSCTFVHSYTTLCQHFQNADTDLSPGTVRMLHNSLLIVRIQTQFFPLECSTALFLLSEFRCRSFPWNCKNVTQHLVLLEKWHTSSPHFTLLEKCPTSSPHLVLLEKLHTSSPHLVL